MWTPFARRALQPRLALIVDALARWGVEPNTLTFAGVWLHAPVVWLLARHTAAWPAGVALALAGAFDSLDGALARATGRTSPFGAFLDSVVDRVSESLICCGLVLRAYLIGQWPLAIWACVMLAGSLLVSYVRARGAGIGVDTKVGWFGRFERVIVLIAGLLSGWLLPAVIIIAVGSWATAIARAIDVWRRAPRAALSDATALGQAGPSDDPMAAEVRA
ncbi:MAG: CDP-alcohol phosphatidyltransferase family protein [Ardenticatenales bacterium]